MRNYILILSIISLTFMSCKKDDPITPQDIITNASMTAKIDGATWSSFTRVTVQKSGMFSIIGTSSEGQVIDVTVKGITVGDYNFSVTMDSASAQCGSIYKPSVNNNDSTFISKSGQVKITSIDTEKKLVSGSFNFIVTKLDIDKIITEGKFQDLQYTIQ
ncbi:MAG: hypothetical protein A2033_04550 [Bacteroidetes bacterium GWA2_31_9]|nr:MAG: hypothetical protein A2033_04550 [Bacteroidetes bacterium GWA2_31_9]